jgi:primary-amine oxidase
VTLTGAGFPPGSLLAADLFSDPVRLGTTVADASGRYRMVVTVPLGTRPGLHTIRVHVVGGTAFAATSLLVTAPPVALRAAQAATLSRTGADFTRRAGLAFVLMVAGFVLVGLAWNDRRPAGLAGRRSAWPDRRRRL